MANFITTTGHAAVLPRLTATLNTHHILGRVLTITDRFAPAGEQNIEVRKLTNGEPVVPILAELGYEMTGPWKAARSRAVVVLRKV